MEALDVIKNVSIYILLALIGFLVWFFKAVYEQHKQIFDYYTRNKETDIHKILMEMETLKSDIKRVESDSKRYWSEHKTQLDNNQTILLQRIDHINDNNKAGVKGIFDLLERLEKRMDNIEK